MSDGELNDIDEQVQILDFAIDGKFDNNRRSYKFGQVDEQVQILEFAIDGKFDNNRWRKNKFGQVDFSSHGHNDSIIESRRR